ncbi:hypothetical protein [Vibrio phage RYC]|nr:hypothetical protein [Vibrio phage RYC]
MNPIKLHDTINTEFKSLGTKHAREFQKTLSKVVAEAQYESELPEAQQEKLNGLLSYFAVCTKGKTNLGCNQALKMVSSAYKRIFNLTV